MAKVRTVNLRERVGETFEAGTSIHEAGRRSYIGQATSDL